MTPKLTTDAWYFTWTCRDPQDPDPEAVNLVDWPRCEALLAARAPDLKYNATQVFGRVLCQVNRATASQAAAVRTVMNELKISFTEQSIPVWKVGVKTPYFVVEASDDGPVTPAVAAVFSHACSKCGVRTGALGSAPVLEKVTAQMKRRRFIAIWPNFVAVDELLWTQLHRLKLEGIGRVEVPLVSGRSSGFFLCTTTLELPPLDLGRADARCCGRLVVPRPKHIAYDKAALRPKNGVFNTWEWFGDPQGRPAPIGQAAPLLIFPEAALKVFREFDKSVWVTMIAAV